MESARVSDTVIIAVSIKRRTN